MAAGEHANGTDTELIPRIREALEVIHNAYSLNDSRQQALIFLENVKADQEAPYHGFTLASDQNQEPVVRHYALSVLEYAIRHRWTDYSESQAAALRGWVLQLSQNVIPADPLYLRNKVAQLWVEIAKRSWAAEWTDMDELLVHLWELPGSVVHKEFVLFVLEMLSDEIFTGDDTVAAMREGVLSKACVEIFTPAIVLAEAFPNRSERQAGVGVRYGEEGWLVRMSELLEECLAGDVSSNQQYQSRALRTLSVYKSVMPWMIPRAIASADCVNHMCKSLAVSNQTVQLVKCPLACLRAFVNYARLPLSLCMLCTAGSSLMRSSRPWFSPCT